MFGGIAFLINGNMACGVNKTDLIVRVDPAPTPKRWPSRAREFDLSRRPMKGWVSVARTATAPKRTSSGGWRAAAACARPAAQIARG